MKREILDLTEYDLIPLIDDYWQENDDYIELDNEGDYLQDEFGYYIYKSGEWGNFELVETILDFYDLEDSYEINNHIIKRLCDNKYFKFYSKYIYCEQIVIPNQKIKEVFPKEKTIVVYE